MGILKEGTTIGGHKAYHSGNAGNDLLTKKSYIEEILDGGFAFEAIGHSADRSSRIMFKENSTNFLYGLSIGYSGDTAAASFPSGATNGGTNAKWYFRRHDNNLNGVEIMTGSRASSVVDFKATPTVNGTSVLLSNGKAADSSKLDNIASGSFLRSDTTDYISNTLYNRGYIVNETGYRDKGVFGDYDSNKINHVWSMGVAYRVAADGANFGTLYGMAYKHTNNTTGGSMAGGHQIVFCNAGTPGTAIGFAGGIWTSGSIVSNGQTVVLNNDGRLSDSRSASDVYSWAKASTKPSYTYSEVGAAASSHSHGYLPLTGGTLTGLVSLYNGSTAPTQVSTDNSTKIATTAFVKSAVNSYSVGMATTTTPGTVLLAAQTHVSGLFTANGNTGYSTDLDDVLTIGTIDTAYNDNKSGTASSGYQRFPGGLTIAWGQVNANTGGTVYFRSGAFTTCYSVVMVGGTGLLRAYILNYSSFYWHDVAEAINTSVDCHYIAVGIKN